MSEGRWLTVEACSGLFYISLPQARALWEEGLSVEKLPP